MIGRLSGCITLSIMFAGVAAAEEPEGQKLFLAQKCNLCHSVAAAKIKATITDEKKVVELTGVVTKRDADWLRRYLRKEEKIEDREHKKAFKGEAKDLDTLVQWLLTLKPVEPAK